MEVRQAGFDIWNPTSDLVPKTLFLRATGYRNSGRYDNKANKCINLLFAEMKRVVLRIGRKLHFSLASNSG
jgi:hypothetical protein